MKRMPASFLCVVEVFVLGMFSCSCGCDSTQRENRGIEKVRNERAHMAMREYEGPKDTPQMVQRREAEKQLARPIEDARKTLPEAKRRFLAGLPLGYSFYVTIALTSNTGDKENAYVQVTQWEGKEIIGAFATEMLRVRGYQMGQRMKISEHEVIDWTITAPDGAEEGNFIGKYIDSHKK